MQQKMIPLVARIVASKNTLVLVKSRGVCGSAIVVVCVVQYLNFLMFPRLPCKGSRKP